MEKRELFSIKKKKKQFYFIQFVFELFTIVDEKRKFQFDLVFFEWTKFYDGKYYLLNSEDTDPWFIKRKCFTTQILFENDRLYPAITNLMNSQLILIYWECD